MQESKLRRRVFSNLPASPLFPIFPVLTIAGIAFGLRIVSTFFTEFGGDITFFYNQALDLFLEGRLSPFGARIVYTNTFIPGSLQQLIFAASLWISDGMPWSMMLLTQMINFICGILIYRIMVKTFPDLSPVLIAAFVFLAPWSYLLSPAWNPAFLPILFTLFLIGALKQTHSPGSFGASFLISLSFPLTLQLHLSFVLLFIAIGICFLAWFPGRVRLNAMGISFGLILGSLTLLPYIAHRLSSPSEEARFLFSNMDINWKYLKQYPNMLLRFLSFPTAETTRFIANARGFRGAMIFLKDHPWFFSVAVPTLLFSALWTLISLRFYFRKENWERLLLLLPGTQEKKTLHFDDLLILLALLVPTLTGFTFLFSVKGPSAHTFWLLFPLSFIPLFSELSRSRLKNLKHLWILYFLCSSIFSFGTYFKYNPLTLIVAREETRAVLTKEKSLEEISHPFMREAVEAILRVTSKP